MKELGSKSATVVTLDREEWVDTEAGKICVTPARDWFFRPDLQLLATSPGREPS